MAVLGAADPKGRNGMMLAAAERTEPMSKTAYILTLSTAVLLPSRRDLRLRET